MSHAAWSSPSAVSVSFGSLPLLGDGVASKLGGGKKGGGGLAAWIVRARCSVNAPWPVPASRISNGVSCSFERVGAATWMSSRDTIRLAYDA